jgi:3-hydroxymyristoyl/3-hydroxydecanoyl-(acyl carrier protein) dehydratase
MDFNKKEIKKMLPHRFPFLFINSVSYDPQKPDLITAERKVRCKFFDIFLLGHFPRNPIFPGVLLMEMIYQTAACLVKIRFPETKNPAVVNSGNAKFRAMIRPGSRLVAEATLKKSRGNKFFYFDGKITCNGEIVVELTDMLGVSAPD